MNHFADITDGANARGVTLANADCAFVKLGRSTPAALDTTTAQLNVLAGGQVDGSSLGIRGQNGAAHFLQRFALRPHGAYDQVAAMKFALARQNPFVTEAISGRSNSPYPATSHSLLTTGNPNVLLWAVKPAEEGIGQGVIARVWNLSPEAQNCTVTLAAGISAAKQVTHIETDLEVLTVSEGRVSISLAGRQIQTLRLLPTPNSK